VDAVAPPLSLTIVVSLVAPASRPRGSEAVLANATKVCPRISEKAATALIIVRRVRLDRAAFTDL
jgi:hypothetical protein